MKKLMVLMMALVLGLGLGVGSASALNATSTLQVANGGIGDLLLGPVYDVRVDENRIVGEEVFGPRKAATWQNLFVIENTSPKWTAVHIRFRESKCSIEVWDHVILLSPYDMFWLAVDWYIDPADASKSRPKVFSKDIETLVNSGMYPNYVDGQGNPFYADFFKTDLIAENCETADIRYGHFEAIGLFQLEIPSLIDQRFGEDTHDLANVVANLVDFNPLGDTNRINVFDVIAAAYYRWAAGYPVQGKGWVQYDPDKLRISGKDDYETGLDGFDRQVLDCGNVLAGNYLFGDLGTAEMGLENLIAIQDFRTDDLNPESDADGGLYSQIHRDRHPSGAIVFPIENLPPYLEPGWLEGAVPGGWPQAGPPSFPFLGGDRPSWYLNPDWATVMGATLRDGDSILNSAILSPNLDNTYYVGAYWQGFDLGFNGVWSLDDLEAALAKNEIWYNYFTLDSFGGVETYTTEVVVTYPTKYLHNGLKMPFWNNRAVPTGEVDWYPKYANTEPGLNAYYADVRNYRCSGVYCNGCVTLKATLWDNDENLPDPDDPTSSPTPSGASPQLCKETNIFWVTNDPGDRLAPNVLYTEYKLGHFRLNQFSGFALRYALDYASPRATVFTGGVTLPPIGLVYFRHTFTLAGGAADTTRSAMAEWHYVPNCFYYGIADQGGF